MAFSKWWTTSVGVQSPSYIITSSDFGFVKTSVGTQLSISQLHHHIIGPSTRLWFCQEHPDKIRLGIVSVLENIDFVWRCFWNFIIYDYSALCALLGNCFCALEMFLKLYPPQLQYTKCSTSILNIDNVLRCFLHFILHNYSALCALPVPTPLLVGRSTLDVLVCAFHASSPGWWWSWCWWQWWWSDLRFVK